MSQFKYNKDNPPVAGEVNIDDWDNEVDVASFPECMSCGAPILNPEFYEDEMCGPCMTGEADTIMLQEDEA